MCKIALNRTYCTFKDIYQLLPHIYKIQNRPERSLVAKFHFSILPLQIEIGRWKNFKNRICKICDEGVESEKHFVSFCSVETEFF